MRKKRTTNDFIEESIAIHGKGTYSYSNTEFIRVHDKVKIFCNTCKKEFEVRPSKHLGVAKQGCQLCSFKEHRSKVKIKDTKYFIDKAKNIHGDLYCYENTVYTTARDSVVIRCNSCNKDFEQIAATHLSGAGCSKCAHDRGMDKQRNSTANFISAAKLIHGNTLDYSKTTYGKNNSEKVIVTCSVCKKDSLIVPYSLLAGSKPICNCSKHHGFQDCKPAILYYLSINNGQAYKIGITNRSVKDRFNNEDLSKITILQTWSFLKGSDARAFETGILNKFKDYKYTGPKLLQTGNTELFNTDITKLGYVQ